MNCNERRGLIYGLWNKTSRNMRNTNELEKRELEKYRKVLKANMKTKKKV